MQTNNNIEKVYELLERYEFAELTEVDRQIVLSVMTETEYANMRGVMDNVKLELKSDIEPEKNIPAYLSRSKEGKLRHFFNYKIKVYQVAAGVAIFFTTFYLFQHLSHDNINQRMANTDILMMRHTDTVHTIIYDTVDILKTKLKYTQSEIAIPEKKELISQSIKKTDCNTNICPNEIENITAMNSRNQISSDSTIKHLLVVIN